MPFLVKTQATAARKNKAQRSRQTQGRRSFKYKNKKVEFKMMASTAGKREQGILGSYCFQKLLLSLFMVTIGL
jgi:hypothetical protein